MQGAGPKGRSYGKRYRAQKVDFPQHEDIRPELDRVSPVSAVSTRVFPTTIVIPRPLASARNLRSSIRTNHRPTLWQTNSRATHLRTWRLSQYEGNRPRLPLSFRRVRRIPLPCCHAAFQSSVSTFSVRASVGVGG